MSNQSQWISIVITNDFLPQLDKAKPSERQFVGWYKFHVDALNDDFTVYDVLSKYDQPSEAYQHSQRDKTVRLFAEGDIPIEIKDETVSVSVPDGKTISLKSYQAFGWDTIPLSGTMYMELDNDNRYQLGRTTKNLRITPRRILLERSDMRNGKYWVKSKGLKEGLGGLGDSHREGHLDSSSSNNIPDDIPGGYTTDESSRNVIIDSSSTNEDSDGSSRKTLLAKMMIKSEWRAYVNPEVEGVLEFEPNREKPLEITDLVAGSLHYRRMGTDHLRAGDQTAWSDYGSVDSDFEIKEI
ncbi:hypothetical protein I302_106855 [Kwoniella bestiolae CBS 10118]|uniref:Uncharacterized protein n=1 Tax=Kwoniella bestiolae CBS 10118 TaxID=1296100 RepID=A0A1B9G077_9TREE|nr:hypothetical protein I302_05880 [Kwoniella bestiolae CBS 10118]OCF24420.1 hypothetical protein I302_05880 [Kwoniella bestiolae CBS 10118]